MYVTHKDSELIYQFLGKWRLYWQLDTGVNLSFGILAYARMRTYMWADGYVREQMATSFTNLYASLHSLTNYLS